MKSSSKTSLRVSFETRVKKKSGRVQHLTCTVKQCVLFALIFPRIQVILVNWCFEPSQPLGIISGLKETFIKRHIVKRTNEAETRPEEQSEKTESCRENLWNEIQLKRQ